MHKQNAAFGFGFRAHFKGRIHIDFKIVVVADEGAVFGNPRAVFAHIVRKTVLLKGRKIRGRLKAWGIRGDCA